MSIQAALRAEHLSGTFDRFPEAVVASGLDRRICYANPASAALFGYESEAMIGQRVSALFATPADAARLSLDGADLSGGEGRNRAELRRRDGTVFLGDGTVSPFTDASGAVIGFLTTIRVASRMERALHVMQSLQSITADSRRSVESKVRAILALGSEHFGLPLGIVSRIEGDSYRVEYVVDPSSMVRAGAEFELPGTYCSETMAAGGPTSFHYVGGSAIKSHPCYLTMHLEAYIGCPIVAGGEVFGTLNFSRVDPCAPFTADDLTLVSLFAQWVGHLLAEQQSREALQRLASVDQLTGMLNRRAVLGKLAWQVAHARRSTLPLSVIMLDVDHFKSINDSCGHIAGDKVLAELGRLCRSMTRVVDVCGRLGGEEFILVLPDTNQKGASRLCKRLMRGLRWQEVDVGAGHAISITASVGVATLRDGETLEGLLGRADEAMYAAKAGGRDQVRLAG